VEGVAIEDLVAVLGRMPGWRADGSVAMSAERWRRLRSAGRVGSITARLVGYAFPARAALDPRVRGRADVVVATTNPFWLPAALAIRRRGPAVIALVYDVYPDSLEVRRPLPAAFRRAVDRIVGIGLRRADAVVFLGQRTAAALVARHGLTRPFAVIATGADPASMPVLSRADPPPPSLGIPGGALDGRVVISYIGNAGSVHDTATLGRALASVLAARGDRIAVVLAATGDRVRDLVDPVRDHRSAFVLGPLDNDAWRWLTARTEVALVSLDRTAGLASLPSKVYLPMSLGRPVLAVAPAASDLADLLGEGAAAGGIRVEPGDVAAAVDGLLQLVDDSERRASLGGAARGIAEAFTPPELAAQWAALLDRLQVGP
jgi:glycosyltransferase involved in cell wall biosynthesis